MQELARNGLAKREAVLFSEFEHTTHSFRTSRLCGGAWCCLESCFLGKGEDVILQSHAAGFGPCEEACFDFRLQVKGNRHGSSAFSKFTSA